MVYAAEKGRGPTATVAMEQIGVVLRGSLGISDSNLKRRPASKADKAARRYAYADSADSAETQLTCTLQTKKRIQVKSRSYLEVRDGWMSIYEDQDPALVRIVIKEAWSAILPILTSLEIHHLFGYVTCFV